MPVALREHQYELATVDYAGDQGGLVFGTEDTGYLTITRPVHSGSEGENNDTARAEEDGVQFGRDFRGGKSVSFEIGVLTDLGNTRLSDRPTSAFEAHRRNLDYLDAIEGWWNDPLWRRTARSMAMLRACEGGRTSRAYGRPRRYEEAAGTLTRSGYTPIVCDFQITDNRWYSDVEYSAEVSLAAPPDGGLIAPLVAPLTTTLETSAASIATVGGSRDTWMVVEFVGPVLNPSVTIGGLTIGLTGSLAYDERVTVDPRPWARTVLRNTDGASLAGLLSRDTPEMASLRVPPGVHPITFRGRDDSGASRARLRWREARSRP